MASQFDDVAPWPEQSPPPAGHNRPPLDVEARGTFREELLKDRPDFLTRAEDMIEAVARVEVTDDVTLGRAGDFVKMLRQAGQHVDAAHKAAKEPYLKAGRAVDEEKNALSLRLASARAEVETRANTFLAQRQAEERAEREKQAAEARRQAEDAAAAEALRREAADANDVEAMEQVPVIPQAVAAPAPREPLRSDAGTTVSTRAVWQSEVTDYVAAFAAVSDNPKVREAIEKAVAALVKAGKRQIDGVRIYETAAMSAR